jgi:hypothetical protein
VEDGGHEDGSWAQRWSESMSGVAETGSLDQNFGLGVTMQRGGARAVWAWKTIEVEERERSGRAQRYGHGQYCGQHTLY